MRRLRLVVLVSAVAARDPVSALPCWQAGQARGLGCGQGVRVVRATQQPGGASLQGVLAGHAAAGWEGHTGKEEDMKPDTIYCGIGMETEGKYGTFMRLSMSADDLDKLHDNLNEKGWVSIQVKKRREPKRRTTA